METHRLTFGECQINRSEPDPESSDYKSQITFRLTTPSGTSERSFHALDDIAVLRTAERYWRHGDWIVEQLGETDSAKKARLTDRCLAVEAIFPEARPYLPA